MKKTSISHRRNGWRCRNDAGRTRHRAERHPLGAWSRPGPQPARTGRRRADARRPHHHAVGRPDRGRALRSRQIVPGPGVFDAVR